MSMCGHRGAAVLLLAAVTMTAVPCWCSSAVVDVVSADGIQSSYLDSNLMRLLKVGNVVLTERQLSAASNKADDKGGAVGDDDTHAKTTLDADRSTTDPSSLPTRAAVILSILTTVLLCFIDSAGILLNSRIIGSWKWSFSRTPTGGAMRAALILLLCLATSVRIVSNVVVLSRYSVSASELYPSVSDYSSLSEAAQLHEWYRTLFLTAPTLLFLSMYGLIVQFWAQVYYAATLYSFPLLKLAFVATNACLYMYYVASASTFHFGFKVNLFHFMTTLCFEATFCLLILGFIYFGARVVRQLLRCRPVPPRRSVHRVLLLSIACPLLFAPRALHFFTFDLFSDSQVDTLVVLTPLHSSSSLFVDSLAILTSEALPAVCILVAFWSYNAKNDSTHEIPPPGIPPWGSVPVLMTRLQDQSSVAAPLLEQSDMLGAGGIGGPRYSGYRLAHLDRAFMQNPDMVH